VFALDHRFALSIPALLSAPSKKSFSSVSSPILGPVQYKLSQSCHMLGE